MIADLPLWIIAGAAVACFLAATIGLPVTTDMVLDLYERLDDAQKALVKERINGKKAE